MALGLIVIFAFIIGGLYIDKYSKEKPLYYNNRNQDIVKEYSFFNKELDEDVKVRVNLTHESRCVSKLKEQQYNG